VLVLVLIGSSAPIRWMMVGEEEEEDGEGKRWMMGVGWGGINRRGRREGDGRKGTEWGFREGADGRPRGKAAGWGLTCALRIRAIGSLPSFPWRGSGLGAWLTGWTPTDRDRLARGWTWAGWGARLPARFGSGGGRACLSALRVCGCGRRGSLLLAGAVRGWMHGACHGVRGRGR
jgi:hypothetical protein